MSQVLESDAGAILDPRENPGAVTSVVMNLSIRIASIEKHLAAHPQDREAQKNLAKLKHRQETAVSGLWKKDFAVYREVYIQLKRMEKEKEQEKEK